MVTPTLYLLHLEPLAQYIREHEDIKRITIKGTEHILAWCVEKF